MVYQPRAEFTSGEANNPLDQSHQPSEAMSDIAAQLWHRSAYQGWPKLNRGKPDSTLFAMNFLDDGHDDPPSPPPVPEQKSADRPEKENGFENTPAKDPEPHAFVASQIVASTNDDGTDWDQLGKIGIALLALGATTPVIFNVGKRVILNLTRDREGICIDPAKNGNFSVRDKDGHVKVYDQNASDVYRPRPGDQIIDGPGEPMRDTKGRIVDRQGRVIENLQVEVNVDGKKRLYSVDGKGYELTQYNQDWLYGGRKSPYDLKNVDAKIHVDTSDSKDLAKIQRVLIPALMDDPELSKLVPCWKTFDPNFGLDRPGPGMAPNGKGQWGKGFTLWVEDPTKLKAVQKRIDEILYQNGLSLAKPIDTGNVGDMEGKSNRVTVTRDMFDMTFAHKNGQVDYGARIDDVLEQRIKSRFAVGDNQSLSAEQLRAVEKLCNMEPDTLLYDHQGHLMLEWRSPSSFGNTGQRESYLDESSAGKTKGHLTDRPAMYSLSNEFGVDQAALITGDNPIRNVPLAHLDRGGHVQTMGIDVGSRYRLSRMLFEHSAMTATEARAVASISADHADIGRDEKGLYIIDHSKNGTYLRSPGQQFNRIQSNVKVYLNPDQEIRFGSPNGPEIKPFNRVEVTGKQADETVEKMGTRHFHVGGKDYELTRFANDTFYIGKPVPRDNTSTKVHVSALNGPDLQKLQEVLIPALQTDPELARLVAGWKTIDPMYGVDASTGVGIAPTGVDQGAKAFTIYAKTPEDAWRIQHRINEILDLNPQLKLAAPPRSGNVDLPVGRSNRVTMVQDTLMASPDSTGKEPLALIPDAVRQKVNEEFKIAPNARLNHEQLLQLEAALDAVPGTYGYDSRGNMVMRTLSSQSSLNGNGTIYLTEDGAGKGKETNGLQKTDRPAYYALVRRYGLDPARIEAGDFSTNNNEPQLREGGRERTPVISGRNRDRDSAVLQEQQVVPTRFRPDGSIEITDGNRVVAITPDMIERRFAKKISDAETRGDHELARRLFVELDHYKTVPETRARINISIGERAKAAGRTSIGTASGVLMLIDAALDLFVK